MYKRRVGNQGITFKVMKFLWQLFLIALQTLIAFAADKPRRARYSAIEAQHLYEEKLISDIEYAKSVYRGK